MDRNALATPYRAMRRAAKKCRSRPQQFQEVEPALGAGRTEPGGAVIADLRRRWGVPFSPALSVQNPFLVSWRAAISGIDRISPATGRRHDTTELIWRAHHPAERLASLTVFSHIIFGSEGSLSYSRGGTLAEAALGSNRNENDDF